MVSAVSGKPGVAKPSVFVRAWTFLREVHGELQKARWPSKEELVKFTAVVILAVVAVAVYMAVADRVAAKISIVLGIFPK